MSRFVILLIFSLLSRFALAQVQFVSPLGNFSAEFPAVPSYENVAAAAPDGETILHFFIHTDSAGVIRMISTAEYSDSLLETSRQRENVMQSAMDGFFSEMGMKPEQKSETKTGKIKGYSCKGLSREFAVSYAVYVYKNTIFQVILMSPSSTFADEATIKAFFKSFKIKR